MILNNKDTQIPTILPFLPVRDVVVFPHMMIPLSVGREKSLKAIDEAMSKSRFIFLAAQKKLQIEDPGRENVYETGTIVEVLQMLKIPDGTVKVLVEGITRARMIDYKEKDGYVEVEVAVVNSHVNITPKIEAAMRNVTHLFEEYVKLNRKLPIDTNFNVTNIEDPDKLTDIVASHLSLRLKDRQSILDAINPIDRLSLVAKILTSENEILSLERKIQGRVRGQIEKSQKEYYLNEQMKAIQKELKQKDEHTKDMEELLKEIEAAKMPDEVEKLALKEHVRLAKMMPFSPEATVVRSYIEWLTSMPWSLRTEDKLNIKEAAKILDYDHYGLEKAKERILEYLAVCKLSKKLKGPILCFVGPPGVGKTSLGKSIARAMGRKFVRMSLGGMRDEAEIRGHRRTYIGALPGRIIQSIRKVESKNPVFLLDEIDKLGSDFRGDPSSALLEVLDPEQNNTFTDHYLEVPFDLSDVFFITTANNLYQIPPPLLDRMEIIRFPGYTLGEKTEIAKQYLISKQRHENGLDDFEIKFSTETIHKIIENYTLEAGVRNLEREIGNVCRKIAKNIATSTSKAKKVKAIDVKTSELEKYLGITKYRNDKYSVNGVGVATGLAWTEVGGDVLSIEVAVMTSTKGGLSLVLTGKLGDVMKESAQAGLSYVRSNAKKLGISEKMFENKEIHIHVPEGAIPKDGPSAGVTMTTAIVSALTNKPVMKNIAMTGEITLRGRVLPVGGVKEKVIAAHRVGVKTIFLPWDNYKDFEEVPKEIKNDVKIIRVKDVTEIIDKAISKKIK